MATLFSILIILASIFLIIVVFIQNPTATIGYDKEDLKNGGNGYIPISLQYGDYTATEAREKSIAGGDPMENFTDRNYKNKSTNTANISDLQLVVETKAKMKKILNTGQMEKWEANKEKRKTQMHKMKQQHINSMPNDLKNSMLEMITTRSNLILYPTIKSYKSI